MANKRNIILGIALVATVAASVVMQNADDDSVVSPAKTSRGGRDGSVKESAAKKATAKSGSEANEADLGTKSRAATATSSTLASTVASSSAGVTPSIATLPEKMARTPYATETGNLFPVRSWLPPPPPPPPPEKPRAPPLPFRFLGKILAEEGTILFLAEQQRSLVVKQGDTINGLYHVDEVTPQSMNVTYLPLKEKQQLNFGNAQ